VEDDIIGEVVLHLTGFSFFFKKKNKIVMEDDGFSFKKKVKSSLHMTTSLFRFFFIFFIVINENWKFWKKKEKIIKTENFEKEEK